jgi:hypothetical protein
VRIESIHFCSRECRKLSLKTGGLLANKIARTNLERHGVTNVFSSLEIRDKIKETWIKLRGVDNPKKDQSIIDASKLTSIERYGVDNPAKSDLIKEKTNLTVKKRTAEQQNAINSKRSKTNLERYGVEYVMQSDEIKAKFNWSSAYQKSLITKKLRGTKKLTSQVEEFVGKVLYDLYGKENVLTQVRTTNRWVFDFQILNLNLYVQVDGVYWHGLNRPLNTIKQLKSTKDISILKNIDKDTKQNQWAIDNNEIIVRFTDKEIIEWQKKKSYKNEINSRIQQKLSSTRSQRP